MELLSILFLIVLSILFLIVLGAAVKGARRAALRRRRPVAADPPLPAGPDIETPVRPPGGPGYEQPAAQNASPSPTTNGAAPMTDGPPEGYYASPYDAALSRDVAPVPASDGYGTTSGFTDSLAPSADPLAGAAPSGSAVTATDTNYTSVVSRAQERGAEADQHTAKVAARVLVAEADAEAMQAVNVDPASIGEQMELVARLREEHKAAVAAGAQAGTVAAGVTRRHGGIKAAHDQAPVRAADAGFYEE